MPEVTRDDVEWVDDDETLGEVFCLTFIKDVDETEALSRLGALPDTLRPRTLEEAREANGSYEAGYPEFAFALNLGTWTVLIEPDGCLGSLTGPLTALSRGTEAVSVQRHEYDEHAFRYAVDGTLVTGFEPTWPHHRWGSEPDRLLGKMRVAGLDPDTKDDAEDDYVSSPYVPALLLAGLITGAVPHPDVLAAEPLSAEIEPWFSTAPPSLSLSDPAMIAALEAAPPHLLRTVAAREIMRLATLLDLDGTPGLAETVAAAERGEPVTVSPDSELGTHVRSWLTRSRQASRSLNDFARPKMSDDERIATNMLGWFAGALKAALWPEPHAAARAMLYPLTQGPPQLRDPAQETVTLHTLRSNPDPT
ncbi:DUF6461 domain-containing protein [Actinomadura sp. 9N407]|uniref:DUF6461 domain-containing protein n=1 Tax=Actinomadura sp. 9N407 TaxID=3375154 RepID=UPI0037998E38